MFSIKACWGPVLATVGVDNPPLHVLANGVSGGDGVYLYSTTSAFPTGTYDAANYWVDVVFQPSTPGWWPAELIDWDE